VPAHPLLVHGAVVLVPVAAVALIATGWRSEWRRHYAAPVAALALLGGIFAFLAKQSGEPLKEEVRRAARLAGQSANFGEHPQNGDTAFIFAMLFGLSAVALWAVDRYRERLGLPQWAPAAAYGVSVAVALIATLTMIVAGHSGAVLAWNDVGTFAAGR
jgi:hypothetical protein